MSIQRSFISAICLLSSTGLVKAEYHSFEKAGDLQGVMQEVRWPYWAESTYNAIYSLKIHGENGVSAYCYGGVPFANPKYPAKSGPASIIWSFWPPRGMVDGAAVKPVYTGPNTYAPPHVGEGASGKTTGEWPQITTNTWYRFVMRIWKPSDGSTDHGFAAQWFRDSKTGHWHHYGTMRLPFAPVRIEGVGGFIEDLRNKGRNPRRTDYRNIYYLRDGKWDPTSYFRASVRKKGEKGNTGLIENGSAVFFENCTAPDYTGNLEFDSGAKFSELHFKQPAKPPVDPVLVQSVEAVAMDGRMVVSWETPPTGSPQFSWTVEGFDTQSCSGEPRLRRHAIDPSCRFILLDNVDNRISHLRFTITDVFDRSGVPVVVPVKTLTSLSAVAVANVVPGLEYSYFEEEVQSWTNWKPGHPARVGYVADVDLTPRLRRENYAFNFAGYLDVPKRGIYGFRLRCADGALLEIGGRVVTSAIGARSPSDRFGSIALEPGRHRVRVCSAFGKQVRSVGDDIDKMEIYWICPGTGESRIPVTAWSRNNSADIPSVELTNRGDGADGRDGYARLELDGGRKTGEIRSVRFYSGDCCLSEDDSAPFTAEVPLWVGSSSCIRARASLDGNRTVDSAPIVFSPAKPETGSWTLSSASDHVAGYSGFVADKKLHLAGDGLILMTRAMKGDCTLTARVVDLPSIGSGFDGSTPKSSWKAGVILRSTLQATPGSPLGNPRTPFAAAFATAGGSTHFQNHTMRNGGGARPSSTLGAQRWLRVERSGKIVSSWVSLDGADWKQVHSESMDDMDGVVYAGVFIHSAPSNNSNVHRAVFEDVEIRSSGSSGL